MAALSAAIPSAPGVVYAQSTRAEEEAKRQQEKSRSLSAYKPRWIERELILIEQTGGFAVGRGWTIAIGDIKRGSGFALGPAYLRTLDNGALVGAKAVYSIRNFKLVQAHFATAPLATGRVSFSGRARWQDAPELPVYALGPDSSKSRTHYAETKTEVSAQALFRPVRVLRFGAGAAFERYETEFTAHPGDPLDVQFTAARMPGIAADPTYVHSFGLAAIDSRRGLGYSRSGTLLQGTLHDYRQQNDGPYSFQRVDGIAEQLIPILHGNWVIDLAVRASTTSTGAGEVVPFFLMPDLGGSNQLRGFANYRFRDRHSILFTAEYRWYAQEFLDVALFYDAGKVVPVRGDLDFDHLKSDYGIGVRFHGPQTTLLRFEVARGREGLRLIFAFSPSIQ
jgi:hypothetical protein